MDFQMFMEQLTSRTFKAKYRAYSIDLMPGKSRPDVENGGKMIMPPSALRSLSGLNVQYPMIFKLSNIAANRESHAGVLEFIAKEGVCYLPKWMMRNLELTDGGMFSVENVSLPVATFSKFQADSPAFLDITNPKAVLENTLRQFACLTVGDLIAIHYNNKVHHLRVLETKPENAVSIIECDMNVDFDTPLGYIAPEATTATKITPKVEETREDDTFSGSGKRLDGKPRKSFPKPDTNKPNIISRGIADYDYIIGSLTFDRSIKEISDAMENEAMVDSPWTGIARGLNKNSNLRG